jgi:nitroimidazol reductase NimA-like FMN-containing flavoprotein (pyridoxamine 5'-phosphate oxidase superfamily)
MPSRQQLEVLDRQQCLDLLRTVPIGRLVFTEDGLPAVHPVNFRMRHDKVIVRVASGWKLAAATEKAVVALQADAIDPDMRTGWSVTVVGHVSEIGDISELVELSGTWLQPWVNGRRDHFLQIETEKVTGRRLFAASTPAVP